MTARLCNVLFRGNGPFKLNANGMESVEVTRQTTNKKYYDIKTTNKKYYDIKTTNKKYYDITRYMM